MNRQSNGIFLSYARKDGEDFAASLRAKLREKAPDIQIKQDRLLLEGGTGFWKQLMDAIDSVEFLVLVMTLEAMDSESVRKEWRYARQQGVCVYPVKGAPDSELQFSKLPRWMGKAHFYDADKEWETFVAHLRKGCDTPRVPFMAPDILETFVTRPDQFERLKNALLDPATNDPIAATTALAGAGGFGKTTLAAALCHDNDVTESFDDGILWVTLGQHPNLLAQLTSIFAALTGDRPGFANIDDAVFHVGQKLDGRTCLLAVDDVWDAQHLRPFLQCAKGSAILFTTRDLDIAAQGQRIDVNEMREAESVALLSSELSGLDQSVARQIAQRLGDWPIALELARASIHQRVALGDSTARAASRLLEILQEKGVSALRKSTAEPRHQTVSAVIEQSLTLLAAEDRQRLFELSVFPEDVDIPLTAVATLWRLTQLDAEEAAQRLARLSLTALDLGSGLIRLHDVLRAWLVLGVGDMRGLHNRLVDGWPDWLHLPEIYAWRWLTWHLLHAGRTQDIDQILLSAAWIQGKLDAAGINSLIDDFEYRKQNPEAETVQAALRLSAHILAEDPRQLHGQLAGRLPRDGSRLELLVQGFEARGFSLVPLTPSLTPPGQALQRTLVGHDGYIDRVAVFAGGTRTISASRDHTLRIWDLHTGAALQVLTNTDEVMAVAVSEDGLLAVSASRDSTLVVWDLSTGAQLHTLSGHEDWVSDLVVYANGTRAVSASRDCTLRLWDLHKGTEIRVLEGHTGEVTAVAVFADGTRVISASYDKTLRVWDLDSGTLLKTLSGHTEQIYAVAVCLDDKRALSGSDDLKLWDLETGAQLTSSSSHAHGVSAIAVSADGTRALTGSPDKTIKVWDVLRFTELQTLYGHTDKINSLSFSPDGSHVVSAAWDKSIKIWDLDTKSKSAGETGHNAAIRSLKICPDGRAITSASDQALKIWDITQKTVLKTIQLPCERVMALTPYARGTRVIMGCDDGTERVMSLEDGSQLAALRGHFKDVVAVAVYANDTRVISASWGGTLLIWDLRSGARLAAVRAHTQMISRVALSSDERRAVSASWDNTVKVWNLEPFELQHTLRGHTMWINAVAFFDNDRRLISASADRTLKVWDVESGTELFALLGHTDQVQTVAVYGRGTRAISGSHDGTLKTWDLTSGAEVCTLLGHRGVVGYVLEYSPGLAVSISQDHTLRLWELQAGEALATFSADAPMSVCEIAGEELIAGDELGRVHFLQVVRSK